MVAPIPAGHEGIVPHLVVSNATEAIDFYKKAFGAEEISRAPEPGGSRLMHAEMMVGGQPLYLADDFPEFGDGKHRTPTSLGATPVTIHRYVENCDAAIEQAAGAGATVTMPASDMFWGDRYGKVTDPYGHDWSFATHIKDLTPEEMEAAAKEAFSQ